MFKRNCPGCGKELSYSTKSNLKHAIKNNKSCKSCCQLGKTHSEEHRRKISKAHTGLPHSEERRTNISIGRGGDGVLDKVWDNAKLSRWTKAVKERDDYICQHCYLEGIPGTGEIEAHHIVPKSKFPQYAYDVDNGQSLCRECHIIEHHKRPTKLYTPNTER